MGETTNYTVHKLDQAKSKTEYLYKLPYRGI